MCVWRPRCLLRSFPLKACSVIPVTKRNEGERAGLYPHMTCKGKFPLHSCPIPHSHGINERRLSCFQTISSVLFLEFKGQRPLSQCIAKTKIFSYNPFTQHTQSPDSTIHLSHHNRKLLYLSPNDSTPGTDQHQDTSNPSGGAPVTWAGSLIVLH
jgi:hypothetical protein